MSSVVALFQEIVYFPLSPVGFCKEVAVAVCGAEGR